jgi:hypothetical protein
LEWRKSTPGTGTLGRRAMPTTADARNLHPRDPTGADTSGTVRDRH